MSQPARPSLEAVVDDVADRCRVGLAAAAAALYGRDATATARALRARAESHAPRWPWLPGPCYGALEPLGLAFSHDDRLMAAAAKALGGRPVRPERVDEAVRQLRHPEPVAPSQAPDPALAAAVDRFWARLNDLARRLGQAVRAGDEEAVRQLLQQARPRLADSAAVVREAAEAAAAGSAPLSAPASPGSEPVEPTPAEPTPAESAPAEPAPAEPAPAEPAGTAPEAVEDETALGPDRPYAPIIFVGLTMLVALILLLAVGLGALGS